MVVEPLYQRAGNQEVLPLQLEEEQEQSRLKLDHIEEDNGTQKT